MRKLLLGALIAFAATACGSKAKPAETPVSDTTKPTKGSGDRNDADDAVTAEIVDKDQKAVTFGAIYFEFDSFDLTEPSKQALEQVADYLKKNADASITIGGHTDEQGTSEYNLALGDKRANVAKDFLVRLGVEDRQVKTITFGEERPAASGGGATADAQNRRDEFQIVPKNN